MDPKAAADLSRGHKTRAGSERHRAEIHEALHNHVVQELFAIGLRIHELGGPLDEPEHQVALTECLASIDALVRRVQATTFSVAGSPTSPLKSIA